MRPVTFDDVAANIAARLCTVPDVRLGEVWDLTDELPRSQHRIATAIRGAVMDEVDRRFPGLVDAWLDIEPRPLLADAIRERKES